MPLISVVIPCHNGAQFIRETLDSVLRQIFQDHEIIVVDDGSTDDSAWIAKSVSRTIHVISTPKQGASAARNVGTEAATGEMIQYLDSDDLLPENALSQRAAALQQSGSDVAYSDWQQLIENPAGEFQLGNIIGRTIESFDPDPEIAIVKSFWCPPAALLFARKIVEKIGGWHNTLPIIQDARFLLDAAFHGAKFVHIPQVGAYYRVRAGGSLSRRSQPEFVRDCFANALEIKERWRAENTFDSKQRDSVIDVFAYVARASYQTDPALFESALHEIYHLDPDWVPTRPSHLALTSKVLGYRNAEFVAAKYRAVKKWFGLSKYRAC